MMRTFATRLACAILAGGWWVGAAWAQAPQREPIAGLLTFYVELNRITPSELRVREGRYLIRIMNGAFVEDLDFQWDDERGQRIGGQRHPGRAAKSQFLVDLGAGRHRLRVPGRAKWNVEITVTTRRP